MHNPVIFEMLSKVENQQRARQVTHIQQLNQAEKARINQSNRVAPPSRIKGILRSIARFAKHRLVGRKSSKAAKLSRPGERIHT